MPGLRETLKELYDGIMEEARANMPTASGPIIPGMSVPTTAQAEAARLYAAAVAKAAGVRQPAPSGATPSGAPIPAFTTDAEPAAAPSAGTVSADPPGAAEVLRALSTLHPDQLAQGIVLAEVLGKPLSRRRQFGR